jgi:hypothetical protein
VLLDEIDGNTYELFSRERSFRIGHWWRDYPRGDRGPNVRPCYGNSAVSTADSGITTLWSLV